MARSDYALVVDEKKCSACGKCTMVCPRGNFEIVDKKSRLVAYWELSDCDRCGACVRSCSYSAIRVKGPTRKVAAVDSAKCDGCEQCVIVCPKHVLEIGSKAGKFFCRIANPEKCCGDNNCTFVCLQAAIKTKK